MKPLRTPEDVAARLQIPHTSVRALARARRLVGIKVGQQWRFDDTDVDAFIAQQRQVPPPSPPAVTHPSVFTAFESLPMPKKRRFS